MSKGLLVFMAKEKSTELTIISMAVKVNEAMKIVKQLIIDESKKLL